MRVRVAQAAAACVRSSGCGEVRTRMGGEDAPLSALDSVSAMRGHSDFRGHLVTSTSEAICKLSPRLVKPLAVTDPLPSVAHQEIRRK